MQNLPVPFDRRVWLECQALVARGYEVRVVCPKGRATRLEVVDGVRLYKYRPRPRRDQLGFASSSPTRGSRLPGSRSGSGAAASTSSRRATRPTPSGRSRLILWRARRRKFVFDQHDLCPELFGSRFPAAGSPITRLLWASSV